jgi:hypothetical protein
VASNGHACLMFPSFGRRCTHIWCSAHYTTETYMKWNSLLYGWLKYFVNGTKPILITTTLVRYHLKKKNNSSISDNDDRFFIKRHTIMKYSIFWNAWEFPQLCSLGMGMQTSPNTQQINFTLYNIRFLVRWHLTY